MRSLPAYLSEDYKLNAKEVLRYLDEGRVPRIRRYAKPRRHIGDTSTMKTTPGEQTKRTIPCLQSRGDANNNTMNTGGSQGRPMSVLQNRDNTGSPVRPSSVLENREKTVTQILGLDQRIPPPTSSRPYLSTSSMLPPAEGGGQDHKDHNIGNAQGIAKIATSLGIMSAKEADVAIRRHGQDSGSTRGEDSQVGEKAALSRMEAPTLRAPPRLHTADIIANERLLARKPHCGAVFVNDYFATDGKGEVDEDVLVSPTSATHHPLDGRPRTTRRRADSAQSTIDRVLHPSKRTVGHLSDVARLEVKIVQRRQVMFGPGGAKLYSAGQASGKSKSEAAAGVALGSSARRIHLQGGSRQAQQSRQSRQSRRAPVVPEHRRLAEWRDTSGGYEGFHRGELSSLSSWKASSVQRVQRRRRDGNHHPFHSLRGGTWQNNARPRRP